jgi:hypothetical protein
MVLYGIYFWHARENNAPIQHMNFSFERNFKVVFNESSFPIRNALVCDAAKGMRINLCGAIIYENIHSLWLASKPTHTQYLIF